MKKKLLLIGLIFVCILIPSYSQTTAEEEYEKAMEILNDKESSDEDYSQAIVLLFSSAEAGYAKAQYALSSVMLITEDSEYEEEAMEWLTKAAKQELPEAMYMLGLCYENGFYFEKDEDLANYWMEKAKEAGYEDKDDEVVDYDDDDDDYDDDDYYEDNRNVRNLEYYSAQTTQSVNFREGPSKSSKLIQKLPIGTWLLIDKTEYINGYYKAYNSDDGKIGYIHGNYVRFIEKLKVDNEGALQVVGTINSPYAEIQLYNDTNIKTTITIGKNTYILGPKERKKATINGGTYKVIATSPGIKPYIGTDVVKGGYEYEWTFYIRHFLR